jgi:ATP/maltotriose-dependent transcriptional regulator MalT
LPLRRFRLLDDSTISPRCAGPYSFPPLTQQSVGIADCNAFDRPRPEQGDDIIRVVHILETAREALAAHDWAVAFDQLSDLRDTSTLAPEDLEALAEAAWWLGRGEVSIEALERAYQEFVASRQIDRALMAALYLSYHHANKGDLAVGEAWRARSTRLARQIPDSPAVAYLTTIEAGIAYNSGDFEGCMTKAKLVTKTGEEHGDPTLVAWGLHWEGLALIKQGHLDRGWPLLDEAMLGVSSGEMKPIWAGFLHCSTVLICEQLGDPRRGWQWIETTERWLHGVPSASVYPGICRIYKARILQERGIWAEAENEARRVCDELRDLHIASAARGYYEIGEISRLRGDFDSAEESFKKAHHLGFDPQPGLACLRLAQGRVEVARTQIVRALDEAPDRLERARLLPHHIEIALVAGDLESATAAADELEAIAREYRSPRLMANAVSARGAVLLAQQDAPAALTLFRRAIRLWTEVDSPYQVALVRVRSGQAHRSLGDEDGAIMEFEAARETFERFGANRDARQAAELLGEATHPGGLSNREVEVVRLVATGKSNRQIAAELFISERTVARHLSNIFAKLAVSSRAGVAAFALRKGLA